MPEIKPIGQQTVHQICSGQVILDLATAVKELLENSLDAGATSIEIKLKEYGKSLVEVIDNGQGVEEANFQGLTLKHHTSKLQDFDDLASVETFGFRGEALSSLCALCNMAITTRHKSAKFAHKLDFDNDGRITKKSSVARLSGTTVTLKDIFHTLPVRRKEFEKNLKREYGKLLNLLNAYCLISTGIRISCSNETGKGRKSVILSTNGGGSVIENVSAIFGRKQRSSLLEFKQIPPNEEICENYFIKNEEALEFCNHCTISGYVSSCGPNLGRSSTDRQFYSINRRPCEMQKLSKVVNEVFHMFNRYQYPFVQFDVSMNRDEVDVNVTPDKRKVFMQKEKCIFAIVKASLLQMYNGNNHAIGLMKSQTLLPASHLDKKQSTSTMLARPEDCKSDMVDYDTEQSVLASDHIGDSRPCGFQKDGFAALSQFHRKPADDAASNFLTQLASKNKKRPSQDNHVKSEPKHAKIDSIFLPKKLSNSSQEDKDIYFLENDVVELENIAAASGECINRTVPQNAKRFPQMEASSAVDDEMPSTLHLSRKGCEEKPSPSKILPVSSIACPELRVVTDSPGKGRADRPICDIHFSFDCLKRSLGVKKRFGLERINQKSGDSRGVFKAKISTSDNQQAEAELSKNFSKSCFEEMEILGQFNLGFIIARYGNDLFIIDQHASDEKYNFENLQKTTVLLGQPLIVPQKLELTAGERLVMCENTEIFNKNGFGFKVSEDGSGQEAIFLTKVPSSRNWTFDASDVSELVFMLSDAPNILCRPSRVRQMFASRACRKSIMVGTALTVNEMKRLVCHMTKLDQPWNCPHGRPTMRHLADLSMIMRPNNES